MVRLKSEHLETIYGHAREGYPHEVCGIIIGRCKGNDKEVVEVVGAENLNRERARDRYEIDPKTMLGAERDARKKGLEIIGFYHTHPDHPDAPSEHDRERAWPVYSYLIVSVMGGKDLSVRSWELNDETKLFEEEKILGD